MALPTKLFFVRVVTIVLLLALSLLPGSSGQRSSQTPDAAQIRATELWEAAVLAKGGREHLHRVETVLACHGSIGRSMDKTVHLYALPNKYWTLAENRLSPLRTLIHLYDLENGFGYTIIGIGEIEENHKTTYVESARQDLLEFQLAYLLESRWVKPTLRQVTEGTLDGRPVNVLYARLNRRTIKYMLDKSTHLPLRFDWYESKQDEGILPITMADYFDLDGIKLPRTVGYGQPQPTFFLQYYLLNAPYDKRLFERSPSIDDELDAWRVKSREGVDLPSTGVPPCAIASKKTTVVLRFLNAKSRKPIRGVIVSITSWNSVEYPGNAMERVSTTLKADQDGRITLKFVEPVPKYLGYMSQELWGCSASSFNVEQAVASGFVANFNPTNPKCGTLSWAAKAQPGEIIVLDRPITVWDKMRREMP